MIFQAVIAPRSSPSAGLLGEDDIVTVCPKGIRVSGVAKRARQEEGYRELSTESTFPAGSRNHAISGPLPRMMPLLSLGITSSG